MKKHTRTINIRITETEELKENWKTNGRNQLPWIRKRIKIN